MKILVLGATGFLGSHLVRALVDARHEVVAGVRARPGAGQPNVACRHVDFSRACHPADWVPLLRDIQVVINAVGVFRESRGSRFLDLHERAPRALFEACRQAGVRRVIQVSALGADAGASTDYHMTKRAADEYLLSLPLDGIVVQPSLVYGPGGASTALFGMLASLPLIPAPDIGSARLQPVHVDDACAAIVALADPGRPHPPRMALVGPQPLSWREFMAGLRSAMGLGRAHFLPVPAGLAAAMARIGDRWPALLLDSAAWRMLRRGNCADVSPLRQLLGRMPRAIQQFIRPEDAPAQRTYAQLRWLLPMARLSMAFLWIATGLLSLGIYPVQSSYALLQRTGVPEAMQPLALYGAAVLDIALGLLALVPRQVRWVWAAQAGLMLAYTLIISWRLPEFWLHPYGPILKNLPLLALLWLLHEVGGRWNTR